MPSEQENHRLQNVENKLSTAANLSKRLKDSMGQVLSAYQRDKALIQGVLTDETLSDSDYVHNGALSPTIGEFKQGLRAILSYAHHSGDLTKAEAETEMADAGISDATVLSTQQIAPALEPLRV